MYMVRNARARLHARVASELLGDGGCRKEPKTVACFVRMARIEMGQRSVGAPSAQGSARDFCPMGFLHEMTGGRQHHGSPLQTEDLVHPFH